MTDLSGIVKAYDVRGLVGEEIDDAVVRDIGAALARLVRAEDPATQASSSATTCATARPTLAAAFADGVTRPGPRRRRHRPGHHRPALLRLRRPRPARRDVHREPQPGPLQRHQAVPRRRHARRPGHRPRDDQRRPSSGRARRGRAGRPRSTERDVLADYAAYLRGLVDLSGIRPLRSSSTRATAWAATPRPRCSAGSAARRRAAVLRARRHLPQPRGQPARPGEPRRPAEARGRRAAPTSAWPSTATPTAASSSTSAASR